MVTPWTPRERALRAAVETALEAHLKRHSIDAKLCSTLAAALTDTPPPDPRDAALGLAEAELLRLWKLVPAGRAGVGGVRTIELEDDEVARLRQIVDAIRAAKGGA